MKQKTTKTYTPKKKTLSLAEFRAWLSGVEEMQAADWHPDAAQWKTIRAKIEDVIDNGTTRAVEQTPEQFRVIRPAGPSSLTGMDPRVPLAAMDNANRPVIEETVITEGPLKGATARIKTPNIDSTHGYKAAFE